MVDHSVGAWDELNESEASQALMFCFDKAFSEKSRFALLLWSVCLALPTRFCVPECHRNRVESSTAEKVFFFSVSWFASERKPKRRRQRVHDHQRNCQSSGWNRSQKMCKRSHLAPSYFIWLNALTGFSDGAVEVHSLGYCIIAFVSCNSVRVDDANAQITSSFEQRISIQEELSLTWVVYWP